MRLPLVALALALSLTACSPTPPTAPTAAPTPAESIPTPTATLAAAPGSRLPIGCEGLADHAAVGSLLGTNASLQSEPETWPSSFFAEQQIGADTCHWANAEARLRVQFLPEAADQLTTSAIDPGLFTIDSFAESSYITCSGTGNGVARCDFGFTTNGYWAAGYYYAPSKDSERAAQSRATEFLSAVAATLSAAGEPLAAWPAPEVLVGEPGCSTLLANGAVGSAIFGERHHADEDGQSIGDASATTRYAESLAGFTSCYMWTDGTPYISTTVALLPGGAWVIDTVPSDLEPVTVDGATVAYRTKTSIIAAVGESLISISTENAGPEKNLIAALEALAKDMPVAAN